MTTVVAACGSIEAMSDDELDHYISRLAQTLQCKEILTPLQIADITVLAQQAFELQKRRWINASR